MRAEDPDVKIHGCSTNSSAKSKRFTLQCQQWHPLRRICDCLSNSHRPWLSKCFGRGPHKLLHNCSRAGHLAYCYFFGIYFILL